MQRFIIGSIATAVILWAMQPETSVALDCDSGSFEGAFDTEVVVPQNLNCDDRQAYWFTDQGSQIIPYLWFLNLEQADSTEKFSSSSNMDRLRYLPQKPTALNPDGLPIGFTLGKAEGNISYRWISDRWLGMTCSACHTGQVEYQGDKFLIDGAPTMGDFETMFGELATAMQATLEDDDKFDRFASGVIADSKSRDIHGTKRKSKLRRQLRKMTTIRDEWNKRNKGDTAYGHGRLDALGAIFNETAVTALGVPENRKSANAPVSYPFVWDTPQHDKVQWNGSIPNEKLGSLGRNVGEVLGVFGTLKLRPRLLLGHKTSVNVEGLATLEGLLWKMQSPLWSDTTLPFVKSELVEEGRTVFNNHCASCHKSDEHFNRSDENRAIEAVMTPVKSVGGSSGLRTDPTMARNFLDRTAQAEDLTGQYVRYLRALSDGQKFEPENENDVKQVHILAHSVTGSIVRAFLKDPRAVIKALKAGRPQSIQERLQEAGEKLLVKLKGRLSPSDRIEAVEKFLDEYGDRPTDYEVSDAAEKSECFPQGKLACYKARPLNGIWATAPYLHNGSVRTMRQLLMPADEREETFFVGTREFDPDDIGFKNEGTFLFDTSVPGNLNTGHDGAEYGTDELKDDPAKMKALLEYLKQL
ncbi:MAG: di-heme-cytochrome C peroxidase [Stappiaceae bacterium]